MTIGERDSERVERFRRHQRRIEGGERRPLGRRSGKRPFDPTAIAAAGDRAAGVAERRQGEHGVGDDRFDVHRRGRRRRSAGKELVELAAAKETAAADRASEHVGERERLATRIEAQDVRLTFEADDEGPGREQRQFVKARGEVAQKIGVGIVNAAKDAPATGERRRAELPFQCANVIPGARQRREAIGPATLPNDRGQIAFQHVEKLRERAQSRDLAGLPPAEAEGEVLAPGHDRPHPRERLGKGRFEPEELPAGRQRGGPGVAERLRKGRRDLRVTFGDLRRRLGEIVHDRHRQLAILVDAAERRAEGADDDRVDRQDAIELANGADCELDDALRVDMTIGRTVVVNGFRLAPGDLLQPGVEQGDLAVRRADIDDGNASRNA